MQSEGSPHTQSFDFPCSHAIHNPEVPSLLHITLVARNSRMPVLTCQYQNQQFDDSLRRLRLKGTRLTVDRASETNALTFVISIIC